MENSLMIVSPTVQLAEMPFLSEDPPLEANTSGLADWQNNPKELRTRRNSIESFIAGNIEMKKNNNYKLNRG